MRPLRQLGRNLMDLLYPRDCLVTGVPLDEGPYRFLHETVVRRLPAILAPRCPRCGSALGPHAPEDQVCRRCVDLRRRFGEARCGYRLSDDVRAVLHAFKYGKQRGLGRECARLLLRVPGFPEFLEGAVVCPVPLHPQKQGSRGFNQAEEILLPLARARPGLFTVSDLLVRRIPGESQTRRDRKERAREVRDAFAVRREARPLDRRLRYLIFDDVFTTGATLNECTRALRKWGARRVDVAAFAHG
jgi:ComF family protein